MKKLLFTLLLIVFIMPITVFAEGNVEIKSVTLIEKSDNTSIVSDASTDGNKLDFNLIFYDVRDYATYKVVIYNPNDVGLFVNDEMFTSSNDHIRYDFSYTDGSNYIKPGQEKTIKIKIVYNTEVPANSFTNAKYDVSGNTNLVLSNKLISVPNSFKGFGLIGIVAIFVIICLIFIGFYQMFKNKNNSYLNILLLFLLVSIPTFVSAYMRVDIPINSKIFIKIIKPNDCHYDGELVEGASYVNGQYTYRYKQYQYSGSTSFGSLSDDGWSMTLTDKDSTAPVTSKMCTSINDKPIVYMNGTFSNSKASSIDLSSFDTSNVKKYGFEYMFDGASNITELDLSNFDTSQSTSFYYMFRNMQSLTKLDLSHFDFASGSDFNSYVSFSSMIRGCTSLTEIKFGKQVIPYGFQFESMGINSTQVKKIDLSNCTFRYSTYDLFYNVTVLEEIVLDNVNTKEVYDFRSMFYGATGVKSLDLSSFDISQIYTTDGYSSMFGNMQSLEYLNISGWDFRNSSSYYLSSYLSLTNNCNNLKTIDASNIKVKGSMGYAFANLPTVEEIILTGVDTSNVVNMSYFFYNDKKLKKVDVSSFNTSKVANMDSMFAYCYELESLNIKNFDSKLSSSNLVYFLGYMTNLKKIDLSNIVFRSVSTRTLISNDNLEEIITPFITANVENFLPNDYFYDEDYNRFTHLTLAGYNKKLTKIKDKHVIKYVTNGGSLNAKGKLLDLSVNTYGDLPTPTKEGYTFLGWSRNEKTFENGIYVNSSSTFTTYMNGDVYSPTYVVLYANWSNPNTYLKTGIEFNKKIKSLATGTTVSNYSTNCNLIKHIKRATSRPSFELTSDYEVSDSGSANKVYAWFDTDTIYIYSSSSKIYLNKNSTYAFSSMSLLEDIDLSMFDFSNAVDLCGLFQNDTKISRIDFSNHKFDNLRDTKSMFDYCSNLKYADISPMDFLYIDGANMFRNDNVDEIVAPSLACTRTPTYMPFTNGSTYYFVDENGVGFHGLTSSMTKGKHYKRAYKVSFNSNGGENLESIYVAFDKNTNISLPTPKYGSRTFLGWFYGNSSSQRANNNMINTVSSDITLYARWDN